MPAILANIASLAARFVEVLCGISVVVLLGRLIQHKLVRQYWPFCGFLLLLAVELLLVSGTPTQDLAGLFLFFEGVKQPLAILLVWDLSRATFAGYPALSRFATKAAGSLLAACALAGGISFLLQPALPAGRGPQLHFFTAVLGALVAGQLAFVFALCIFAGWFPVQMARNLIRLLVGWLVILAVDWTGHQLANTNPGWANFANVVTSLSLLATASYWTVTLNAEGATQIVGQALRWDADRMDRMTTQLNRMGAQLSRRGY